MKILCLKFEQNRTLNEQFDFFEGKGGGGLNLIFIGKHMKLLCFKFQQNHTISEDFDFFEGGEGGRGRGPHL